MRIRLIVDIAVLAWAGSSPLVAQASLLIRRAEVPKYPSVALAARLVGVVKVDVTVTGGVITDLRVRPSRVSQGFVNAALVNIRSWEFVDAVDTTFLTTYIFRMSGKRTALPENPRIEMRLPHYVRLTGTRTVLTTIGDPSPTVVKPPSHQ